MRSLMLAVLVVGLAGAPSALAAGGPIQGFTFQEDEPFSVFVGSGSYLGVDTRDVTSDRVAALKLKEEAGVEVVAVDQDAPAGKAGIKEKDVILSFNNQKVDSVEQLRRMIREVPPGRQVSLGIVREGQNINLPVTVGDRKQMAKLKIKRGGRNVYVNPPVPPVPPMGMIAPDIDIPNVNVIVQSSARNGLMVESLTPQLSEFFGVKGGQGGVLVRSVEKGSAAESAGLKAGDVIVRVDKDSIDDVGDWRRAIRNRSGNAPVVVIRDKREQTFQMNFPARKARETGMVIDGEDFDVAIDMEEFQQELERIRPQIEKQTQEISFEIAREVASHRAEIQKALADAHKEVAKALKAQHKELEKAHKEIEKELEKEMKDAEKD